MGKAKAPIDWEKIGKLYRLGQLSVREIARQEGVQPSSITRRAEKEGWTRDLSEIIEQKTRAKLISNARATPDATDVALAVATNVAVIQSHRSSIAETKEIVGLMLAQLKDAVVSRPEIEEQILKETAVDMDSRRYNQMMRAISLPTHAGTAEKLANTMKTLFGLERQAFNIGDEPPKGDDTLGALLEHVAKAGSRLPIKPQNKETP